MNAALTRSTSPRPNTVVPELPTEPRDFGSSSMCCFFPLVFTSFQVVYVKMGSDTEEEEEEEEEDNDESG